MTDDEYLNWLKMREGPRISRQEFIRFQRIAADGHIQISGTEDVMIDDRHIISGKLTTKVLTESGQIVGVDAIKLRCSECKAFEAEGARCWVCNRMVCIVCLRRLDDGTGEKAFCQEHFRHALHNLNTWLLADRKEEKQS